MMHSHRAKLQALFDSYPTTEALLRDLASILTEHDADAEASEVTSAADAVAAIEGDL